MMDDATRRLNPAYVVKLIEKINTSPFLRQNFMKVVDIGCDSSTVEAKINDVHLQALGMVHGGVYAALIDTAAYWAAFGGMEQKWGGLVSVDLKVNFLSSASEGRLLATGRLIKMGKTLAYAEAKIETEDGKLVAHGTSTLLITSAKSDAGKDLPPKVLPAAAPGVRDEVVQPKSGLKPGGGPG